MIVTKRHKHRDESPTRTRSPPKKLFVDYPYPQITELNKIYKQQKQSKHSPQLTSLRWYKDSFHKMTSELHSLCGHDSPTSILEESFKQAHLNGHSSKTLVNNLQKKLKPTRIKRVLPSSMTPSPSVDDQGGRRVRTINKASLDHQTDDDH